MTLRDLEGNLLFRPFQLSYIEYSTY